MKEKDLVISNGKMYLFIGFHPNDSNTAIVVPIGSKKEYPTELKVKSIDRCYREVNISSLQVSQKSDT